MGVRQVHLTEFCRKVLNGTLGKSDTESAAELIDTITPEEIVKVVDLFVTEEIPFGELKPAVSKILNVFGKTLDRGRFHDRGEERFLSSLAAENLAALQILQQGRSIIRDLNKSGSEGSPLRELKLMIKRMSDLEIHYGKMENIVFPLFERGYPDWRCVRLLWSIHDDARKDLKKIGQLCDSDDSDPAELNRVVGRFYFNVHTIIFREETIIFPLLQKYVAPAELDSLFTEGLSYGFAFLTPVETSGWLFAPPNPEQSSADTRDGNAPPFLPEQTVLEALFRTIPLDMTFIDADDRVRWFSEGPERVFPRSRSVIGRDVRNCHPAESVDKVEKILRAFRSGKKESETFWINMKGKLILIEYFALRTPDGEYLGTLEVTRDITAVREISGEKRL
jgi:PAS domain S-box-containing protein